MNLDEYLKEQIKVNEILKSLPGDPVVIDVSISFSNTSIHLRGSHGLQADYSMPSNSFADNKIYCKKIINGVNVVWYEQMQNDCNPDV